MVDKAHDLGKAKGKTYESLWADIKPKLGPDSDQKDVIMKLAMKLM